jgi:4-amino-4-deoxy-L-arabinose transferase-like glycosyltransferase
MTEPIAGVDTARQPGPGTTLLIIAAVVVIRLLGVILTPLNLGPDEAQYWRWGQSFEWGYWSKPPLIGWVIGATTSLFGDAEWAVRLAAPLTHGFGAVMLLLLGRAMFGVGVGTAAALIYLLMPGITLSSAIISTDGLLLPLWAAGLFMLWRLRSGEGGLWSAAGLGAAIGVGFLAKYAMVYFLVGLGLVLLTDRPTRRALFSLNGLVALGLAAAIFAPHMAWNAANSFKTVSHTADNANWGAELLNPENALTFLVDQMGVFGPITFLVLLAGLFVFSRGESAWWRADTDRFLLAFILPPLIIILVQAVISRAHANWAATAYPAASVLVTAWLYRARGARWVWPALAAIIGVAALFIPGIGLSVRIVIALVLAGLILLAALGFRFRLSGLIWASIAIHAVAGSMFFVAAVSPPQVAESLGLANAFKRTRGWEETTEKLARRAVELDATAIVVDERENWHGLDYYGRKDFPVPIRSWRVGDGAKSYAEEFVLTGQNDSRALIASVRPAYRDRMTGDFGQFEPAGEDIVIDLGGGGVRRFEMFLASDYAPVLRSEQDAD